MLYVCIRARARSVVFHTHKNTKILLFYNKINMTIMPVLKKDDRKAFVIKKIRRIFGECLFERALTIADYTNHKLYAFIWIKSESRCLADSYCLDIAISQKPYFECQAFKLWVFLYIQEIFANRTRHSTMWGGGVRTRASNYTDEDMSPTKCLCFEWHLNDVHRSTEVHHLSKNGIVYAEKRKKSSEQTSAQHTIQWSLVDNSINNVVGLYLRNYYCVPPLSQTRYMIDHVCWPLPYHYRCHCRILIYAAHDDRTGMMTICCCRNDDPVDYCYYYPHHHHHYRYRYHHKLAWYLHSVDNDLDLLWCIVALYMLNMMHLHNYCTN